MPIGYWNRTPKKTAGLLQQALKRDNRPDFSQLDPKIWPKSSISAHLSQGEEAYRRTEAILAA